jgi:hypothetical protein
MAPEFGVLVVALFVVCFGFLLYSFFLCFAWALWSRGVPLLRPATVGCWVVFVGKCMLDPIYFGKILVY